MNAATHELTEGSFEIHRDYLDIQKSAGDFDSAALHLSHGLRPVKNKIMTVPFVSKLPTGTAMTLFFALLIASVDVSSVKEKD